MRTLLPLLVLALSPSALAELSLPAIFGNGMVLQRETQAAVWGQDEPGQQIELRASWTQDSVRTTADGEGNWSVELSTPRAGGPHQLTITGSSEVQLRDVLVGEVWICSGQSNMEWPMTATDGGEEAIASANHPRLRLFDVRNAISRTPEEDCEGTWAACTPASVRSFSAVGYWFGRDLMNKLPSCSDGQPMPIGLVAPNWGGTVAESWTSREGLAAFDEFQPFFEELDRRSAESPDAMGERQQQWWDSLAEKEEGLRGGWNRVAEGKDWAAAPVPGSFADWGQGGFDGCAWYNRSIELPANMVGQELVLELGAVDDMDLCFLDGQLIGATQVMGRWNQPRRYAIPASMATKGTHVVSICAVDTGGAGYVGGTGGYARLRAGEETFDLAGTWSARKGTPISELGNFPSQNWFHQNRPTALHNGMIAPLGELAVQGAIWYQGESNRPRAQQYRRLFPAMIQDWRRQFGEELDFLFVQLAPFGYGGDTGELSELREAQAMTLSLPRTGMAVTMDIGNPRDIHPRDKRTVGERLARWALAQTYGIEDVAFSGPVYRSVRADGDALIVELDHAVGLRTRDGEAPSHFLIAGEDKVWHPATARIEGKTVHVHSAAVNRPVAVRYGWGATDEPNLENGAGLPAGSFRSDDWPMVSAPR